MARKSFARTLCLLLLLAAWLSSISAAPVGQSHLRGPQSSEVSAYDLIIAMNTLRMSYGLPALVEDPIINAVAQSTAKTMAASEMSWHIGNVSGRLEAAGYGGGSKVWATENFAVGNLTIDQIMVIWSDASHMIPAVNPAYCNVGAGVARTSGGRMYYVLQAAYLAGKACGEYTSPGGSVSDGGVSQRIVPVKIATADAEGKVYHVVEAGQSFWAIAVAYQITIQDLETWNNLSKNSILRIGQRLFIPGPNTEGYSTPTPVGMIQTSTPGPDGKIIHTVQEYQTLTTIARAYGTTIATLLALNSLQADWPLRIGQKLLIHPGSVTPSATPRPLTPLEKLTPASDGKVYHIVKAGENLSWIAAQYEVGVAELMAWNGLSASSILQPDQRLLLHVTPPPSPTSTPGSPTPTLTATKAPPTPTPPLLPTQTTLPAQPSASPPPSKGSAALFWAIPIGLILVGSLLAAFLTRKKL